jgi:hypothetical protein
MGKSKNPTINFRVIPEHKRVLQDFAAEIMATRPYWKEADVWKELMGITDEGVITNEMRRRLRERLRDAERPLLPPEPDRVMRDDPTRRPPYLLPPHETFNSIRIETDEDELILPELVPAGRK